ncbi:MAG: YbaB/EbfC family nucleoid-associated protein [Chloroflexi bacterium]|nr:YbaB/EbfC family nucleoid-associated protein [Chloroflexota bacterium]
MFGNMNMIKQMQAKLLKIQEELAKETVEVSSGGGAVTVTITGHQKVESVKIDPEVVDPDDVEMLQDLILSAMNEAIAKSQEMASKRLSAVTGGLKIPGLP